MCCRMVHTTRDAKFCFLYLRRLICNRTTCVKIIVCPQHTSMPPVNVCVSDALLNVAVQNVYSLADAVAKYSNDVKRR